MDAGSFIEYDMYLEHDCADFGMQNEKVSFCIKWTTDYIIVEKYYKFGHC